MQAVLLEDGIRMLIILNCDQKRPEVFDKETGDKVAVDRQRAKRLAQEGEPITYREARRLLRPRPGGNGEPNTIRRSRRDRTRHPR